MGQLAYSWANLTPFSLQPPYIIHLAKQAIKERALEVDTFSHVTSKPHSPRQHWHRDAGALFDGVGDLESHQLPPHGVVTFVPLIDVSEELGPTEYLLKSHIPCPPNEKVDIITPHETNSIHEGIRVTLDECAPGLHTHGHQDSFWDPLGGLARPTHGFAMQNFLRESL